MVLKNLPRVGMRSLLQIDLFLAFGSGTVPGVGLVLRQHFPSGLVHSGLGVLAKAVKSCVAAVVC